jgi:hypothetical protein
MRPKGSIVGDGAEAAAWPGGRKDLGSEGILT